MPDHYAKAAMNLTDPIPATNATEEPDAAVAAFYRDVLLRLDAASVPYLVGGTYAFNRYTGINRPTKDLDLFIRRSDFERVSAVFQSAGYRCELTFPHWLGKIHLDDNYIDLIFSSGNAVASVDDAWFEFAADAQVLGLPARISPIEEMIWSKAFIMEKERFDGADIAHL
ncbi:MAG: nucleotidyltransferase domain-containing protein, partial [Burkholderiaceae bacterium]